MLFLATVISYIDRQAMSVAAPVIAKEFGFSNEEIAQILSAFLFAYAFGQLLAGYFLDRIGSRIGFAICITLWSLANALTATSNRLWEFGFFRFMLGIGESGNFPGGVKVINEWFPPHERAFVGGIFTSGASIGAVIAAPLIATIIHYWGWKVAFIVTGSLGFVWVIGWLISYKMLEKRATLTAEEHASLLTNETEGAPDNQMCWIDLFKFRQVWALVVARLLEEPVIWLCLLWLPKYMVDVKGLSLLQTGWTLIIPFVALDIGYVAGGWASSRLARSGWEAQRAKLAVMIFAATLMIGSVPAMLSTGAISFICFISLAMLGHGSWFSNMLTMPSDIAPRRLVASVYGISALGGGLSGIVFTEMTGIVADRFDSFAPVFLAAGFLPALATAALILLGGRMSRLPICSTA